MWFLIQLRRSNRSSPKSSPSAPPADSRTDSLSDETTAVDAVPEGFENEQMVWEMMYNPSYNLPTEEAEGSWKRAVATGTGAEQVRVCGVPHDFSVAPSTAAFF